MGFRPVPPEHVVDWAYLFGLPGREAAQRAKRIDGRLARVRDLMRGQATGLPSGEAVADELGEEPLSADEVGLADYGWTQETPLWLYVLKEADVRQNGERLGPVGGRIVGDVLIGLLDADPESQRTVRPDWRPTLPAAGGAFGIADFVSGS